MSETEKAPDTPPRERTLPTEPEQLAAQAAQIAAGQALADIMRRGAELVALNAPDADFVPVQNETVRRSQALLRAYPPAEKGGAR